MTLKTSFLPLLFLLLLGGCRTVQYVPVKEYVQVAVHDTTRIHTTDTLVKVPEFHLSDFAGLRDTLTLTSGLSTSRSWVDTVGLVLCGELEQTGSLPVQVRWKERVVWRDSIRTEDKPYPVEVTKEVRYVPWYSKALSFVGLIALLVAGIWVYRKIRFPV